MRHRVRLLPRRLATRPADSGYALESACGTRHNRVSTQPGVHREIRETDCRERIRTSEKAPALEVGFMQDCAMTKRLARESTPMRLWASLSNLETVVENPPIFKA